jgi:nicotinate-nucleotide adenylyltransferase
MNQPDGAGLRGQAAEPWQSASRVAFFGGSFDPPHLGHLAVARAARVAFGLNAVLFAPVGAQPLKPEGSTASYEHRVAMTRLAIEGEQGFFLSLADAPKPRGGGRPARRMPNYTIETLESLRAVLRPDSELYCLMGADAFFGLRRWHRAGAIPFAARLIVASRPGQPLDGLNGAVPEGLVLERAPAGDRSERGVEVRAFSLVSAGGKRAPFYVLPGLDVEISATEIRTQMREGNEPLTASAVLAPRIAEYIRAHGLYR